MIFSHLSRLVARSPLASTRSPLASSFYRRYCASLVSAAQPTRFPGMVYGGFRRLAAAAANYETSLFYTSLNAACLSIGVYQMDLGYDYLTKEEKGLVELERRKGTILFKRSVERCYHESLRVYRLRQKLDSLKKEVARQEEEVARHLSRKKTNT